MEELLKIIAFYLPQFYRTSYNDKWWGNGFTEWTNVTKCKPIFKNHKQPMIPADLGFYDLRVENVRIEQAELAKKYGIFGFCYYHYWFHGERILELPIDELLRTNKPDFPFCLCWANETWTRSWSAKNDEVLLKQKYSKDDHKNHINYLINLFKDKRYIKINGSPLFLLYKAELIEELNFMVGYWNNIVIKNGFPGIYFISVIRDYQEVKKDKNIFNNYLLFHPNDVSLPKPIKPMWRRLKHKLLKKDVYIDNNIIDYSDYVRNALIIDKRPDIIKCIMPRWDNTPRRNNSNALIMLNPNPKLFSFWLRSIENLTPILEDGKRYIFINAWNEWGEGNFLEPDIESGHSFLSAIKR